MKAWQITRFGIDGLALTEVPAPRPGPGEVLVRWRAQSINYRDLVIVQGTYFPDLPLPFQPGSDAAGEVVEIGRDVAQWQVGDRVIGHYVQSWQEGAPTPENTRTALGVPLPGVFGEFSVLPEHGLVRVPAHLSFEEAATLPIAAVTAWNALFTTGDLAPGDTVVLEGTGGVSLFGLQLAHAAGLRTVITSSSEAKLARARALGADHTINYRTTPDWSVAVREVTGGRGADLVLDVGGPATINEALRSIRMGGRITVIGFLSGSALPLDAKEIIGRAARIHAVRVGSRAMFRQLNQALAQHAIRPVIDQVFDFTALPAALERMSRGEQFGKIALRGAE